MKNLVRIAIGAMTSAIISAHAWASSVEFPADSTSLGVGLNAAAHSAVDISAWENSHRIHSAVRKEISNRPQKLRLASGSALVIDQNDGTTLYSKNPEARMPIASITKLMTAMVVLDGSPSLEDRISIGDEDVDHLRNSVSHLGVGSKLSRGELLQLALMASENRAASALSRAYPGGQSAFVGAMNAKARELGMTNTYFADPTGLNSRNMSTASDLAKMVKAAYGYDLIRQITTTPSYIVAADNYRPLRFHNTNALVHSKEWDIGLSKTGYINEAGHCLVMQTLIAARPLIIVLLDAQGKMTRVGDANRIKHWMEAVQRAKPRMS